MLIKQTANIPLSFCLTLTTNFTEHCGEQPSVDKSRALEKKFLHLLLQSTPQIQDGNISADYF
jgi:hypothetical protein